ncbi:MAG: hypothetical protein BMS9Abin12_1186 [Acidimicrobiia bacterium]|nr:MAG: hypothetical protein BMS9Abin12_1186 [Acidimicrobiia bacterium]
MHDPRIEKFLTALRVADQYPPLSDAKLDQLGVPDHVVVVEEADEIVAIGATAAHRHTDGSQHWAVETAVTPGLRFPAFEDHALQLALELVPAGEDLSVWSRRSSLSDALERSDFALTRELAHYVVDLPLKRSSTDSMPGPFRNQDTEALLAVNREAFAGHREASALDEDQFARLAEESWFDPSGLLLHREDDELVAFCWTRVHPDGDGEIYRIAVAPGAQGTGVGRSLVIAGFEHLSRNPEVMRGTLWVDLANRRAVSMYQNLGMTEESVNREYQKHSER